MMVIVEHPTAAICEQNAPNLEQGASATFARLAAHLAGR